MPLIKRFNANGQKAYQRDDTEDRSLPYRNWIRTIDSNGFFVDIDFIKIKSQNGSFQCRAITELTRCDSESAGEKYRQAIIDRYFTRDHQGKTMSWLGELLGVPVYLVLFQKEMKWLWVYSFRKQQWHEFTPTEWAAYLHSL